MDNGISFNINILSVRLLFELFVHVELIFFNEKMQNLDNIYFFKVFSCAEVKLGFNGLLSLSFKVFIKGFQL